MEAAAGNSGPGSVRHEAAGAGLAQQFMRALHRFVGRGHRQETGVTLGHWRQQARLLRALEVLCGGSVTEAALSGGL